MDKKTTNTQLNINGASLALKTEKLLKKLIHVLSQETLAMQSHNRSIANNMAQEKTQLLANYKSIQEQLKENPEILRQADEDVRTHLKEVMAEFEIILCDNIRAIQSGRNAVRRIMNRILTKARDSVEHTTKLYNSSGKMIKTSTHSTMTPVKINETL